MAIHRSQLRALFFIGGACRRANGEGPRKDPEGGRSKGLRWDGAIGCLQIGPTAPSAIAVGVLRDVGEKGSAGRCIIRALDGDEDGLAGWGYEGLKIGPRFNLRQKLNATSIAST